MRIKSLLILFVALGLAGLPGLNAYAQTPTPPEGDTLVAPGGDVVGQIVNKSPGGTVLEQLDLMLHIWDKNYNGIGMLHGQSQPDGSFLFSDVGFDPDLVYAVMASYNGVTYFSDVQSPELDATSLEFELPIYETAADLSAVSIDQSHVLFYFDQGGLEVLEMYILSNAGEYTVADAVTLEDGRSATLQFPLPEEAIAVTFNSQNDGRFIQFPGGFADTAPIAPGQGSTQVAVRYFLPYTDQLEFVFAPPMGVERLEFLIAQDDGIQFAGDGLTFERTQTTQDGFVFDVYSHPSLKAGESIDIAISGRPTNEVPLLGESDAAASGSSLAASRREMGLGALVLGLALVAAGIWWWRRPQHDLEDEWDDSLDSVAYRHLIAEIAALDDTYRAGEISEEDYQQQREALILRGKVLLMAEEEHEASPVDEG